jgi:hypothetical protein
MDVLICYGLLFGVEIFILYTLKGTVVCASHALPHIRITLPFILSTSLVMILLLYLYSSPDFWFKLFISYMHKNVNLKQAIYSPTTAYGLEKGHTVDCAS